MQSSEQDRLTVARLSAISQRYAATGATTDDARISAVAELAGEAAGRSDLLAEHAGICLGRAESEDGWQATIARLRAELAIQAGADEALLPGWLEVGRERASASRRVPYTGVGENG
jgi:hypothetical protein